MAAYRQVQLLAVVAALACLASLASGTTWMVGDAGGWRARFNETGWANGKTFVVGDSLMFMYPKDSHTVVMVGQDVFAACNLQGNQLGFWSSGADVVPLTKPGKVWFFCSKPGHCINGMKLVIDVVDHPAFAPAPLPPFRLPQVPGTPTATAPSPIFRFPFPSLGGSAPAPATPEAAPPSAAARYPVGGAAAAAAAAVVAAALAF